MPGADAGSSRPSRSSPTSTVTPTRTPPTPAVTRPRPTRSRAATVSSASSQVMRSPTRVLGALRLRTPHRVPHAVRMAHDRRRRLALDAQHPPRRVGRIGLQRREPAINRHRSRTATRHAQRTKRRCPNRSSGLKHAPSAPTLAPVPTSAQYDPACAIQSPSSQQRERRLGPLGVVVVSAKTSKFVHAGPPNPAPRGRTKDPRLRMQVSTPCSAHTSYARMVRPCNWCGGLVHGFPCGRRVSRGPGPRTFSGSSRSGRRSAAARQRPCEARREAALRRRQSDACRSARR